MFINRKFLFVVLFFSGILHAARRSGHAAGLHIATSKPGPASLAVDWAWSGYNGLGYLGDSPQFVHPKMHQNGAHSGTERSTLDDEPEFLISRHVIR
jgi:hypothetical protein